MATIILLYVLVVMSSIVTNIAYAQNEAADVTELKNILFDYYPGIIVEYGTDSVVALKADEEFLLGTNGTLAPLWEAIDRVEGYGYVLDEMSTRKLLPYLSYQATTFLTRESPREPLHNLKS